MPTLVKPPARSRFFIAKKHSVYGLMLLVKRHATMPYREGDMRALGLIAMAFGIAFTGINANAATGNEILAKLLSSDANENLQAFYYIDGVVQADDAHLLLMMLRTKKFDEFAKERPRYICIPDGVTKGQIYDVALKYLQDNPEDRHRSAALLARTALWRTWPCP